MKRLDATTAEVIEANKLTSVVDGVHRTVVRWPSHFPWDGVRLVRLNNVDLVVMFLCVALVVGALVVAEEDQNALAALGSLGAVFFLLRRSLPTKAEPHDHRPRHRYRHPQDVQHERDAAVKATGSAWRR